MRSTILMALVAVLCVGAVVCDAMRTTKRETVKPVDEPIACVPEASEAPQDISFAESARLTLEASERARIAAERQQIQAEALAKAKEYNVVMPSDHPTWDEYVKGVGDQNAEKSRLNVPILVAKANEEAERKWREGQDNARLKKESGESRSYKDRSRPAIDIESIRRKAEAKRDAAALETQALPVQTIDNRSERMQRTQYRRNR